ncbi:hypothetical protein M3599_12610 [Niallia circulans]|uniref:hypothetical protein n=1 Tax=Niallia circulans TaxID=1397 RepID=UPI00203AAAAF|nr:hypothetical protein [Niallia circulans]MCM2981776.1 hypothetical protein [Niallia circulans]
MGYKGDKVVEEELVPVLSPAQLKLDIWEIPEIYMNVLQSVFPNITQDVIQIECSLLDRSGKLSDYSQKVAVSVQNGRLLGIENGKLDDVTDYTEPFRTSNRGKLVIYVQKNGDSETQVKVETDGIRDTLFTFKTIN